MHPRAFTPEQNEKIVVLINELLTIHGYTQTRLAEALGASQSTVSNIRSRKQTAGFQTGLKVCQLAGVDLNDLIGLEPTSSDRDAHSSTTSLDLAKAVALSEQFDQSWVSQWTCDIATDDLSADQVWTLLQADYLRHNAGKASTPSASPDRQIVQTLERLSTIVSNLEAKVASTTRTVPPKTTKRR